LFCAGCKTFPVPEIFVHAPVSPAPGGFPANATLVVHTFWSGPALAFGGLVTVKITSSDFGGQVPFETVHLKVVLPLLMPLTAVVGLVLFTKVAFPVTTVQIPEPTAGGVAASDVEFPQKAWSGPAKALN
jgi:hypothetical protein